MGDIKNYNLNIIPPYLFDKYGYNAINNAITTCSEITAYRYVRDFLFNTIKPVNVTIKYKMLLAFLYLKTMPV